MWNFGEFCVLLAGGGHVVKVKPSRFRGRHLPGGIRNILRVLTLKAVLPDLHQVTSWNQNTYLLCNSLENLSLVHSHKNLSTLVLNTGN